jgi:hypothetical protein
MPIRLLPPMQVVVVVTSELRVMCLDHNLKQMWEHDLSVSVPVSIARCRLWLAVLLLLVHGLVDMLV